MSENLIHQVHEDDWGIGVPDCTGVVPGGTVAEVSDHTGVVLGGTVEEHSHTEVARDPLAVGVAKPVAAGEGQIESYLMPPFKGPEWGEEKDKWLVFRGIRDLIIKGSNQIDGRGSNWWKSCNNALSFEDCSKLRVGGITHINSARNHISIYNCVDVLLEDLRLYAPNDSPNTDGINIGQSRNIQIVDTFIGTGDDCVAINSGSYNITITRMTCGPGHGISIGSLGKNGDEAKVEDIHVKNSILNASDNGVRIKTWQGGKGYVRKISFEDITFIGVANPIVIDQYYCPYQICNEQSNAVQISDVSYIRARGTTRTSKAIILNCSKTVGCNNIMLDGINISAVDNKAVSATCINAHGSWRNSNPPVNCLN
ncbi:probable polygalacturonase At3g15720 [Carica papaya]|uniref:probable polygalacturonase At3g15720 n=1 Tax=Carica papaya TaxID=3649 RepID=UPI000B8CBAD6|nr:probable polygalacturonase At3g15720 [Carica papaya]